MYYRLKSLKEQDTEVAQYLRPGQFVILKFNKDKGNTEVHPMCKQKSFIGEIQGRVREKYAQIKSCEPLKLRMNFEFELLAGLNKEKLLMKELEFLEDEINRINYANLPEEKRRRRKYKIWAYNIQKRQIKKEVSRRGIDYIYHFTCIENLNSILNRGVISLNKLEKENIKFLNNDPHRLDDYRDSTSWSISHPNYFYLKQIMHRYPSRKWCIIEARAEILWKKKCYYSEMNAANSLVRCRPETERVGIESFNKMFDYKVKDYIRQSNWHSKYPTDVQAEVLVFDDIELSDVSGIYLSSVDQLKFFANDNINFFNSIKTSHTLFQYRIEQAEFEGVR